MRYFDMIQKVQDYSGFTEEESKDALQLMVESISVRLAEPIRHKFASQLPSLLKILALSVLPTKKNVNEDIVQQFMSVQQVGYKRAKMQIKAAWRALKDGIGKKQMDLIRTGSSSKTNRLLS